MLYPLSYEGGRDSSTQFSGLSCTAGAGPRLTLLTACRIHHDSVAAGACDSAAAIALPSSGRATVLMPWSQVSAEQQGGIGRCLLRLVGFGRGADQEAPPALVPG